MKVIWNQSETLESSTGCSVQSCVGKFSVWNRSETLRCHQSGHLSDQLPINITFCFHEIVPSHQNFHWPWVSSRKCPFKTWLKPACPSETSLKPVYRKQHLESIHPSKHPLEPLRSLVWNTASVPYIDQYRVCDHCISLAGSLHSYHEVFPEKRLCRSFKILEAIKQAGKIALCQIIKIGLKALLLGYLLRPVLYGARSSSRYRFWKSLSLRANLIYCPAKASQAKSESGPK